MDGLVGEVPRDDAGGRHGARPRRASAAPRSSFYRGTWGFRSSPWPGAPDHDRDYLPGDRPRSAIQSDPGAGKTRHTMMT